MVREIFGKPFSIYILVLKLLEPTKNFLYILQCSLVDQLLQLNKKIHQQELLITNIIKQLQDVELLTKCPSVPKECKWSIIKFVLKIQKLNKKHLIKTVPTNCFACMVHQKHNILFKYNLTPDKIKSQNSLLGQFK